MAIVLIAPTKDNLEYWKKGLEEEAIKQGLNVPVLIGPETEKDEEVKMAVVWKHQPEMLYRFPKLQLISSMGAGVDHILKDKKMPADWQVVRIVDNQLSGSMSNYLLAAVLNYHKRLPGYIEKQAKKEWAYTDEPERPVKVGILGLGELGSDIAKKLVALGFPVFSYSSSPKKMEGVKSYAGEKELPLFLQQVNVLICLLPLTEQTRGFLNLSLFEKCTPGTYLINVARGEHLEETDLVIAIEKGWISGAMLDVFKKEPLPGEHPFWEHPSIFITPHIASVTHPDAAIPQIVENYKRLMNGEALMNEIDRKKGY